MPPSSFSPNDLPRLFEAALGKASFKLHDDDFQVDEVLGFDPSGDGEHCLLWIEKRGRNTNDVATDLAERLGIRRRLVSHCGLKDKHAVTRQWFSIHLPGKPSPTADDLDIDGVQVLSVTRNLRKLQRGAHDANRFTIRLRDFCVAKDSVAQRWHGMSTRGVPNYFGPQRFGHNGANVDRAVKMFASENEVKDRALRGILISAARSFLFNTVVAARVSNGTWDAPRSGEVYGFANNRSLVLPSNLHGDEGQRFADGNLELTAPLWGQGDLQSEDETEQLEQAVIQQQTQLATGLQQLNLRQERRVMRLKPTNSRLTWETDSQLVLRFQLPKGTYATTMLRELADLSS